MIARITAGVAIGLLIISTLAVVITVRRPLPSYSGTLRLPGLSSAVTVHRDERGIPHIYADHAGDLFFAQGYTHAQDRFFQMDYRRHLTAGRLSELVGANEEALTGDMIVRTMGWRRVAERELEILSPQTKAYLQAYADGVNAYLADRSPSELSATYLALGLMVDLEPIEPWTPVDSLAWFKAMAWDLRAGYLDELGRGIAFGSLAGRVDLVEDLYPSYPYSEHDPILASAQPVGSSSAAVAKATGVPSPAAGPASSRLDPSVEQALDGGVAQSALNRSANALQAVHTAIGSGAGLGSNSWVVSGQHTTSGTPLLANDGHLAASAPSVWSQVGLHCREVDDDCPFDVSGYSFAGTPGVIVGHNGSIAWGLTNLPADASDLFLEQIRGDAARRGDGYEPLAKREETIKVVGGEPVTFTVRSSRHGPLISDVTGTEQTAGELAPVPPDSPPREGGYSVAMAWTALQPGRTADAIFALNQAQTFEEVRQAARLLEVPAQSLLYADTQGHIGYQAAGRIPTRATGGGRGQADGTWPRAGWDPAWDWTGYVPFEQMPYALDPAEGFIVSANQAVTPALQGPQLSTDWEYGYRSQRIRTLLSQLIADGKKVSAADFAKVQVDEMNPSADFLIPYLREAPIVAGSLTGRGTASVSEGYIREAIDLLYHWDRRNDVDSPGAAYYNAVWSNLMRLTFADQLPTSLPADGDSRWVEVVRNLLKDEENPLWDDARTAAVVETRDQILGEALYVARLELTSSLGKKPESWSWGKLHTLEARAPALGWPGSPALIRRMVNVGPVPVAGGSAVVNATSWSAAAQRDYSVDAVPTMRMVVDLGEIDSSTWVDLTGISGHPWSGHYRDQFDAWLGGEQYPWPFGVKAVEEASRDVLTLDPAP